MMKFLVTKVTLVFCLFVFSSSCQEVHTKKHSVNATDSHFPIALTLQWETDTLLTTIESVVYDSEHNYIYTANINGHFMNKDGNGYISKVSAAGEIIEMKWVKGLDAPTGLGIYQGKLYTTDIDKIVEIDIANASIDRIYPIDGAKALNDVAIAEDGTVYVSDTGGNQIFSLKDGQIMLVKDNIDTPNGLLVQGNQLMVSQWNPKAISILNLNNKVLSPFVNGIEGPDGIEVLEDGSYLVSGFNGLIYHVSKNGAKRLILDTTKEKIQAADIDYIAESSLLLVPTMSTNKVFAYEVDGLQSQELKNKDRISWLESSITTTMEKHDIPALSIGVILDGELFYERGFGKMKRGTNFPVTEETIYQIASLTKMFTGIVVNNLVLEEKLILDNPITTYLPETLSPKAKQQLKKVKVQHLLRHQSGFPRSNPSDTRGWAVPMKGYSEQQLLKDLNVVEFGFEPGTNFSYSNFGYAVLGYICERVSEVDYALLIERYISEPYRLKNTTIQPDETLLPKVATPYDPQNRKRQTGPWVMGKSSSSGSLYSNVVDLTKLMMLQMKAYQSIKNRGDNNVLILTDETNEDGEYGFGLVKSVKNYGTFYNHRGDMSGFASSYIFRQEDNFGLILQTSSGGRWFEELEEAILSKLLGI